MARTGSAVAHAPHESAWVGSLAIEFGAGEIETWMLQGRPFAFSQGSQPYAASLGYGLIEGCQAASRYMSPLTGCQMLQQEGHE